MAHRKNQPHFLTDLAGFFPAIRNSYRERVLYNSPMESSEASIREARIEEAKRMYSIMKTCMTDEAIRAIAVHLFDAANPRCIPIEEEAEVVLFPRFPPVTQRSSTPEN
jgi:hypothetical protein